MLGRIINFPICILGYLITFLPFIMMKLYPWLAWNSTCQTGVELGNPLASQVLGLQICVTLSGFHFNTIKHRYKARKMVQWVKCLVHKHKDLSLYS